MDWQSLHARLTEIAADSTRGARELVREAALVIRHALESEVADAQSRASGVREQIVELAQAVLRAQPEMAPFYYLAAALLDCADLESLSETVVAFADALDDEAIGRHAVELIPPAASVVTYSRSGSVLAALRMARSGRTFEVWVGEGRPRQEGRGLAAALAEAGIKVQLLTDGALLSRAADADLILLGADAIGREKFLNKVGTRALCATAGAAGCPVYVLADETKFLPEEFWPSPEERSADEVWSEPAPGVLVSNPYFEAIPLAELEAVVTQQGPLAPSAVLAKVDGAALTLARLREWMEGGSGA